MAIGQLITCIAATIFVSAGSGLITFGALTANRFRDEEAAFVAVGIALIVMGMGVVASWLFVKRH